MTTMPNLFDLTGHVSLITGGNSGIGLGFAKGLVQCGATVAICGTNAEKNAAAVSELVGLGGVATAHVCDVGDEAAVIAFFGAAIERYGRIDSVFANAGVNGRARSFVEMSTEEWHRVMRVNLDGAFFTCRQAARHMKSRFETGDTSGGSIVLTTSGSAYYGQARGQNYASSKGALISLMKAIAVEHARHGVRCNAVLPGWTETELTAAPFSWDKFVAAAMPRVPARRWGTGHDFSGIAAYLASPASAYHTGDVITIDGGYHSF